MESVKDLVADCEFVGEFLAPRSAIQAMLDSGRGYDEIPEGFAVPPAKFAVHARRSRLITVSAYRRLRVQSPPPLQRDPLPGPTRIGDAAAERVSSGESICDVAASAFLSENELRRDYL